MLAHVVPTLLTQDASFSQVSPALSPPPPGQLPQALGHFCPPRSSSTFICRQSSCVLSASAWMTAHVVPTLLFQDASFSQVSPASSPPSAPSPGRLPSPPLPQLPQALAHFTPPRSSSTFICRQSSCFFSASVSSLMSAHVVPFLLTQDASFSQVSPALSPSPAPSPGRLPPALSPRPQLSQASGHFCPPFMPSSSTCLQRSARLFFFAAAMLAHVVPFLLIQDASSPHSSSRRDAYEGVGGWGVGGMPPRRAPARPGRGGTVSHGGKRITHHGDGGGSLGVLSDEEERRGAHGGREKRVGGLHLAGRLSS